MLEYSDYNYNTDFETKIRIGTHTIYLPHNNICDRCAGAMTEEIVKSIKNIEENFHKDDVEKFYNDETQEGYAFIKLEKNNELEFIDKYKNEEDIPEQIECPNCGKMHKVMFERETTQHGDDNFSISSKAFVKCDKSDKKYYIKVNDGYRDIDFIGREKNFQI